MLNEQTPLRESPMHVALRFGHLQAAKILLEAPNFDVIKCDAFQRRKVEMMQTTALAHKRHVMLSLLPLSAGIA
jgi:hypothetical protein